MKKVGIVMGVVILGVAGVYYSLSASKNPDQQQSLQTQLEEVTQQNKNTSSTSSSAKSKQSVQKPIMNTITGENVPEGFYDEVLSDGYTYNNPKPLDMSLVTPNENPNIPGHINEKDYYANISVSQIVPDYPLNTFDGTYDSVKYTRATNYNHIEMTLRSKDEANYPIGKEAFTKWFKGRYGKDFVFTGEDMSSNEDFNQKGIFSIIVIGGDVNELKDIVNDMKSVKIFADNLNTLVPGFYRTPEYDKVISDALKQAIL